VSPLRSIYSSLYASSVWAPPVRRCSRGVTVSASIYSAGYHPSASRGRPLAITPPHPLDEGQVRGCEPQRRPPPAHPPPGPYCGLAFQGTVLGCSWRPPVPVPPIELGCAWLGLGLGLGLGLESMSRRFRVRRTLTAKP